MTLDLQLVSWKTLAFSMKTDILLWKTCKNNVAHCSWCHFEELYDGFPWVPYSYSRTCQCTTLSGGGHTGAEFSYLKEYCDSLPSVFNLVEIATIAWPIIADLSTLLEPVRDLLCLMIARTLMHKQTTGANSGWLPQMVAQNVDKQMVAQNVDKPGTIRYFVSGKEEQDRPSFVSHNKNSPH